DTLGTINYNRLRIGVGSEFGKGKQVDYVLGEWSEEEGAQLKERLHKLDALIRSFVLSGVAITMNQFNGT
ncbi:MAG: aminoacyl-tRNA hydrolase, partial [Flavobacteriales bacterium]